MRRTNGNRVDTEWKRMCDKDWFLVNTTEFSNLKALDGHWGYEWYDKWAYRE